MLRHGLPPWDLWDQPLQQVLPSLGSLLHFPADSALRMLSELEPSLSLSYQIELVAIARESLHFPLKQRFQLAWPEKAESCCSRAVDPNIFSPPIVGLALCWVGGPIAILDLRVALFLSCEIVLVNVYDYVASTVRKTSVGFHFILTSLIGRYCCPHSKGEVGEAERGRICPQLHNEKAKRQSWDPDADNL